MGDTLSIGYKEPTISSKIGTFIKFGVVRILKPQFIINNNSIISELRSGRLDFQKTAANRPFI